MNDSGTPTFNVCRQIYDVATNPTWNVNSQLFIDAIKPLLLAWRGATSTNCAACGKQIRDCGCCGCDDKLLAKAVALLRKSAEEDSNLVYEERTCLWRCVHCHLAASTVLDFHHASDCWTVERRAFLAREDVKRIGGENDQSEL